MAMTPHRGWHSRGYLPHFDSPETIQFVTFRLADSLPRQVVEALRLEDDALARIDGKLDGGLGACWLRQPEVASIVQNALLHFDGTRYRLLAWCLMPNHVHVVIEMVGDASLSDVLRSLKSFTARRANAHLHVLACRLLRPIRPGRGALLSHHRLCRAESCEGGPGRTCSRLAMELGARSESVMSGPGGPRSGRLMIIRGPEDA
jgi:hypothetical protein